MNTPPTKFTKSTPGQAAGKKLWGGRFSAPTAADMEAFNASIHFDRRLLPYDVTVSTVYARMLQRLGLLDEQECERICTALGRLEEEAAAGVRRWDTALEDVHTHVEVWLVEAVGEAGRKLHAGRSRNDLVVTSMRLYLRDQLDEIDATLNRLLEVLIELAEREADSVMPGYTHLQTAQPVTFGHHMLAWFEMLLRDRGRLRDCRRRADVLPLGAAALAGSGFPLDRAWLAAELGFSAYTENSLDAISDRDCFIEFVAAAAMLMMHLSRCSEELVLWSSHPFAFVELPDAYCTGSSIMPQKKNPDAAELVRGKSGRVYGSLLSLLTMMKAQPLAYNRDNQEDKEPFFDCADTLRDCLRIYAGMLPGMQVRRERLREAAEQGYSNATEVADYLVRKGVPFRDAHEAVGGVVRRALKKGRPLAELSLAELQQAHPAMEKDIYDCLRLEAAVGARDLPGGTAPGQVRKALERARRRLRAP